MSESKRVVCGKHGETPPAFMCRHLASGVACGYHADPGTVERWPDAWCDLCNERLEAAGWSEEAWRQAEVKVLCTHCYEEARDRNRVVPKLAIGAGAQLSDAEQDALIHHAVHDAQARQAASDARWHWKNLAKWFYDHEAQTMTFSEPGHPTVVADVRMVGSYATSSGTFQWAWALYEFGDPVIAGVWELQAFGEIRGMSKLTTTWWECLEPEAWEMTSLAAYLLGAEGIYRAPFDDLHWFMLLNNWRTVN